MTGNKDPNFEALRLAPPRHQSSHWQHASAIVSDSLCAQFYASRTLSGFQVGTLSFLQLELEVPRQRPGGSLYYLLVEGDFKLF